MATCVFIDGAAGTTGLEIRERLAGRSEFALLVLDDASRKDENRAARCAPRRRYCDPVPAG
jgi:N-acetyl-gamma-glutamyl-phosphate reductase